MALAVGDDKIVIHEDFNAWCTYGGVDDDAIFRLFKLRDLSKIDDHMREFGAEEWDVFNEKVTIHSKVLYPDGYDGPKPPEKFGYLVVPIGDTHHHFKVADYYTFNDGEDYITSLQALGLHPSSELILYANPIEYELV